MSPNQSDNSYETGEKVWQALQDQLKEGRGFLAALSASLLNVGRRYFVSLLLFGLLFAGVGVAVYFLKPQTYTAEMTVSYEYYEKKIYADMLGKLNDLVDADQYDNLSGLLNMPEQKVEMLKSVTSLNMQREPLTEDLSTGKIPFYIIVQVKDTMILAPLQRSIVNYLNGTDYIQKRLNYRLQEAREEQAFLQKRMALIDSLSKLIDIREDNNHEKNMLTPMELMEEAKTLNNRLQQVKREISFNENIEVLDGFLPSGRQDDKDLIYWLLYGFLGGILLRLLLLALIRR